MEAISLRFQSIYGRIERKLMKYVANSNFGFQSIYGRIESTTTGVVEVVEVQVSIDLW